MDQDFLNTILTPRKLRQIVRSLPEFREWPDVLEVLPANDEPVRMDWQLPGICCEAVGESSETVLNAMAAIACLHISIILVDDLLDEEPGGAHHYLGVGRTGNLALALQAAAHVLVEQCPLPQQRRTRAALLLSHTALGTAYGQDLDVQNLDGEESYWQVVRAKSTPFYGAAFQLGAILGGAGPDLARQIYEIGAYFGEAIQIVDDLEDAFATPANPDWLQGRNNLLILYGLRAEYPGKDEFLEVTDRMSSAQEAAAADLKRAQELLVRSGAVGYAALELLRRHAAAMGHVSDEAQMNPEPIDAVFESQMQPFLNMLKSIDEGLAGQFMTLLRSAEGIP